MRKPTKKQYREYLNSLPDYKNGRYGNTKRLYGDYLYSCDKEKFNVDYAEWSAKG